MSMHPLVVSGPFCNQSRCLKCRACNQKSIIHWWVNCIIFCKIKYLYYFCQIIIRLTEHYIMYSTIDSLYMSSPFVSIIQWFQSINQSSLFRTSIYKRTTTLQVESRKKNKRKKITINRTAKLDNQSIIYSLPQTKDTENKHIVCLYILNISTIK